MAEPHSVGPMDNCISSGAEEACSVVIVSTNGPDNATSVEAAGTGRMGDGAVRYAVDAQLARQVSRSQCKNLVLLVSCDN